MELELILKFLLFVRSIREANIELYISILTYWTRGCFLFDHQNYARYATTHLVDLWSAKREQLPIYKLLEQGIFTANKSNARFSNIHLDQNHEQFNDYLKKCGGIVGLTEDPQALKRFLVCSPLVSELCKDFENGSLNSLNQHTDIKPRHAESAYLQERFLSDNKLLYNTIITQGNPFSISQVKLINIYTHEEAPASDIVYKLEEMANTQYKDYISEVFIDASRAIYTPIKQNNVTLFPQKNVANNKTKSKLASSQNCNKVITNLFIASQQRNTGLENLFSP